MGIIIPTDELIFFRGVEATNQLDINDYIMVIHNALANGDPLILIVNNLDKCNATITSA